MTSSHDAHDDAQDEGTNESSHESSHGDNAHGEETPHHVVVHEDNVLEYALPVRRIAGFGWKRDLPDIRDVKLDLRAVAKARGVKATLPTSVDLRDSGFSPPVYDQGQLGSCTANAIGGAFEYEQKRQGLSDYLPSRLFIYYNERVIENTVNEDSGAQIRDGMKAVAKLGVPHETLWPYADDARTFKKKPSTAAFADGLKHQCITYAKVAQTVTQIKTALAAGLPVVFGFSVYESFEDTGDNGMVIPDQGQIIGGHAVCIWGYRTIKNVPYAVVRNSWASGWGDGGYCYFPLAWLCDTQNASDFWAISSVEK